jgi:hypothetical protein
MQDFRKKIVRPVAFCAILLCLLMAASAVMSALARTNTDLVQNRNKSMVELENEPADTIDVLVIGDSESYTTVSPMEIWDKEGIPSYVGGQTGQKIQESYYMLKKALKTQKPKVVAIETNMIFRSQSAVRGIKETLVQTMLYYFPVFRLHNSWKAWVTGEDKRSQTFYKGFVLRDVVEAYTGGSYMKKTAKTERMSRITRFMMDQIVSLCRKNNIQLFLYSAPPPGTVSEIHSRICMYFHFFCSLDDTLFSGICQDNLILLQPQVCSDDHLYQGCPPTSLYPVL